MYFRVFLKVNIQNQDNCLGCKSFKYFFGVLQISDIFLGCTVDPGSEPTYAEKLVYPPWSKTGYKYMIRQIDEKLF